MCSSNYYKEEEARSLGDKGHRDLGGRSGGERASIFYVKSFSTAVMQISEVAIRWG